MPSAYQLAQDADTPLARWRFDQASGTTVADDIGTRTMTVNNPITQGQAAIFSFVGGGSFDFAGGYLSAGSGFNTLKDIGSIEARFTVDTLGGSESRPIFTHAYSSSNFMPLIVGFNLDSAHSNQLGVGFYTGAAWRVAHYATALTPGTEYHVVGTYAGTTLTLYLNGIQVATSTVTARSLSVDPLSIAYIGRRWDSGQVWDGRIADVALYQAALTQSQVTTHVQTLVDQSTPPTPVLSGIGLNASAALSWAPAGGFYAITDYEYRLDGGSAVTTSNASGSFLIGSLTNGTTYGVQLRSVTASGTSAWSNTVSVTPSTTILLYDDFNRANNTSVLGNPVQGPAPTVLAGTWGINNNKAYISADAESQVVWDVSAADVDITVVATTLTNMGVVIRAQDTSNFYLVNLSNGTSMEFYVRVAGVYTLLSASTIGTLTAGDTIRVLVVGDEVWAFRNGVAEIYQQMSRFSGLTKHGLRAQGTGSSNGRWDSIMIQTGVAQSVASGGVADASLATLSPETEVQSASYIYKGRDLATDDTVGAP